jgi:methylmalonyl-CoA mutase
MAELKAQGIDHMLVVVGGVIPPQEHELLFRSGVCAVFGPGTRIPTAAGELLDRLEKARDGEG